MRNQTTKARIMNENVMTHVVVIMACIFSSIIICTLLDVRGFCRGIASRCVSTYLGRYRDFVIGNPDDFGMVGLTVTVFCQFLLPCQILLPRGSTHAHADTIEYWCETVAPERV